MNLDDPSRQRLGGFPMYYWQGRPVGPLSGFTVSPTDLYKSRVIFNLMVRPGVSNQFIYDVETNVFPAFYTWWFNDPEACFALLGWTYDAPAVKSLSLSLKDLGL